MCCGNTTVCRTCGGERTMYRTFCPRAEPHPSTAPHRTYGIRTFIQICAGCKRAQWRAAVTDNSRHAADVERAKTALEYYRGLRDSPWTERDWAERQQSLWNEYRMRRILHPFQTKTDIEDVRQEITRRAALLNSPSAAEFPARWEEAVRRQREMDITGRLITEDDQRFGLSVIRADLETAETQLTATLDSISEIAAQLPQLVGPVTLSSTPLSSRDLSPRTTDDGTHVPATFLEWTRTRIQSPLERDLAGYLEYLAAFPYRYLDDFLDTFIAMQAEEQRTWNFLPAQLPIGQIPTLTFRTWYRYQMHPELHLPYVHPPLENLPFFSDAISAYARYLSTHSTALEVTAFVARREDLSRQHRRILEAAGFSFLASGRS